MQNNIIYVHAIAVSCNEKTANEVDEPNTVMNIRIHARRTAGAEAVAEVGCMHHNVEQQQQISTNEEIAQTREIMPSAACK